MTVRTSKRSSQLALPLEAPKRGSGTNGGRRPKNPCRRNVKHRVRVIAKRWPVHVVIRLRTEIPSLRCAPGWNAVRGALATQLRRRDFRICHLSVQRTHLHLLVEADNAKALASGMGGFQIALARRILVWMKTRGDVFSDRYFATSLRTPTQIRNALAYILNNCQEAPRRPRAARNWGAGSVFVGGNARGMASIQIIGDRCMGACRDCAILGRHHRLAETRNHFLLREAQAKLVSARRVLSTRGNIAAAQHPRAKRRISRP